MKNYLIGGLVTIAILGLFSYKTTDNDVKVPSKYDTMAILPLKQKIVVTTDDINYVNKLVKQGYVVEFVTYNANIIDNTYTLIKY